MGRKWQNIKLDKGKTDAQRGAVFTKLSKEITLAAKGGSPDPDSNHRLKLAVEKARENNMPQDNIKRAITRGAGGTGEKEIEELRYEGLRPAWTCRRDRRDYRQSQPYGGRVSVHVYQARRDAGRNRYRGVDVRRGWHHRRGSARKSSEDALTEAALVDGVIDIDYAESGSTVYTEMAQLAAAREALRAAGIKVSDAYLGMRAKQTVAPEGSALAEALAFLELVDSHEDVAHVFSNLDVSDAALEALV